MDASKIEGESFGSPGPVTLPDIEWTRSAEATEAAQLARAISHNADLAQALSTAQDEIATLHRQLDLAHETANDLAELVIMFVRVFQEIRSQVGNGIRTAIDAALAEMEIPDDGDEEAQLYGGA